MENLLNRSILSIKGTEAKEFLQTQLTCDILLIKDDSWNFFGYCNRQGKLIANGYLYCQNKDEWFIIIDKSLVEQTLASLNKVALLAQVSITIPHNLGAFVTKNKAPLSINIPNSKYYLAISAIISNENQTEEQSFYHAELSAKLAIINLQTYAKFTPQMLNLDNIFLEENSALSFKKGCYIGQEVISKIYHKGINKKIFTLATTNQKTAINQTLFNNNNQAIGTIIQIAQVNQTHLLGCILPNAILADDLFIMNNEQKTQISLK